MTPVSIETGVVSVRIVDGLPGRPSLHQLSIRSIHDRGWLVAAISSRIVAARQIDMPLFQ
jgi:hypothetical protein